MWLQAVDGRAEIYLGRHRRSMRVGCAVLIIAQDGRGR
jgi:hypothetical protein